MKKILIIEDEKDIRLNLIELFTYSGYKIFSSDNGAEGILIAEKEHPDVILCDVMMNVLDGFQVRDKLAENPVTKDIPLVFLTAKAELVQTKNDSELKNNEFVLKPYDSFQLLDKIEKIVLNK